MDSEKKQTAVLTLPGHISYLPVALGFVEESAKILRLPQEEISRIRLAAEEAVSNVMLHGLANNLNETFEISCISGGCQFAVRILEKGRPFSPDSIPAYSPEEPENMKGLGTFLMKSVMDEVHFNNLGRNGKETLLIKYFSAKKPDFDNINTSTASISADFTYKIRRFEPKDAQKVSECAYSAYGYSYEPFIYYPDKIVMLNNQERLISFVAETDSGEIAGHAALKYDGCRETAELGCAFVNPAYRGKNVFRDLADTLSKEVDSRRPELKCLFASCVTGHISSQKQIYGDGHKTTALMLALLPADVNFKNLVGKIKQKESAVTASKIITEAEPQTIHTPAADREMITRIFGNLGLSIRTAEAVKPESGGSDGEIFSSAVIDVLNCGIIICRSNTAETPAALRHKLKEMCMDNISVVYLYLDMTDPASPFTAEACRRDGFVFAGIKPYGHDGKHSLILQYINNLRIDFSLINLADPFAVELRDYIEAQYKSAL